MGGAVCPGKVSIACFHGPANAATLAMLAPSIAFFGWSSAGTGTLGLFSRCPQVTTRSITFLLALVAVLLNPGKTWSSEQVLERNSSTHTSLGHFHSIVAGEAGAGVRKAQGKGSPRAGTQRWLASSFLPSRHSWLSTDRDHPRWRRVDRRRTRGTWNRWRGGPTGQ